jgi:3-oxoacyl-[acyl-carrier-protein] synthase II
MNEVPVIAAIGVVDAHGIAGTGGVRLSWRELDAEPPGSGRTFRAAFGRSDETFRRLDAVSRVLVLAAEAADLSGVLPADLHGETALVIETTLGCLDADLQFAASLGAEMPDAPVFPYTLPSTCLGEVALRHALRGPSVCLCVEPSATGSALAEAARLLANGEAPAVVVGSVDVLRRGVPGAAAACDAVIVVLARRQAGLAAVAEWIEDAPTWAALRAAARA